MAKRTKYEILEDRMLNAGEAVGYSAWRELRNLEKTVFHDGLKQCSTCGAPIPTEAAFAKHYLVDDERYLNLGNCPTRYNNGVLMPPLHNGWGKDLWFEAHEVNRKYEEVVPLTRHNCTNCGAAYHSDEEKATICNRCSLELPYKECEHG